MKDKLKEGDKVVMHTCAESDLPKYKNKLLTCTSESFIRNGNHVVFLKEVSGYFLVDFLQKVDKTYINTEQDSADKYYIDGKPSYRLRSNIRQRLSELSIIIDELINYTLKE